MRKRLIEKQPEKQAETTRKRIVGKQSERKRLRTKQSVKASVAPAAGSSEAPSITAAASKYDDILRKIYYDVKEGFGSIADTWKAAKKRIQKLPKRS